MKIKSLKKKISSDTFSEAYPIGADAVNVDLEKGTNVEEEITSINSSIESINNSITSLTNNKLSKADVVDNLITADTSKALSANQGKVLNDGKLNKSDIINNLTTTDTSKALSAAQGKALQDQINEIWKKIYPVGSVYLSVTSTNPSSLFGGTWVAWGAGRVPVGINTGDAAFNTVEKTGGAKSNSYQHAHTVNSHAHSTSGHVLTVNEIPAHGHSFSGQTSTTGNHMHMYRDYWSCAPQVNSGAQCVAANSDVDANPGAHSKDGGNHSHAYSGTTSSIGGNAAHSHGNTGAAAPGTSPETISASTLQPYITCYMWKRTA